MVSKILNVASPQFACVRIHGEPVQNLAARFGGKGDAMLSKDDIVSFLGGEVAARAAGYTDAVHDKLLAALHQNEGKSINISSLWNPEISQAVACKLPGSQSNISVIDALYKIEDPTKGVAHRGVVREARRIQRFGGDSKQVDESAIVFDNMFPGGRMGNVLQTGPATFTVISSPENAPPINESPWYAFRIHSPAGKQRVITLNLAYDGATHRYPPKISNDGINWQALAPQSGTDASQGHTATFPIALDGQSVWISAQELVTSSSIEDWAKAMTKTHSYITLSSAGKSHGGRSLPLLKINKGKTAKPTVVIIGRQHPPEVTGTLAQMQFVEALCDGGKASEEFLQKFNVIVMPNMNPDGVDQGHWRHNGVGPCKDANNDGRCDSGKGGVDLNRDWQAFNEPETRAARAAIQSAAGHGVAFFIDFHSTYQDVMYVAKENSAMDQRVSDWMARLAKRETEYHYTLTAIERKSDVFPKTSIGWADKKYGAPVVTYEVGDGTPRDRLRSIALSAAYALMDHLLQPSK